MGSLLDPALPRLVEAISQVLLGKQEQVRLALACLLAGGHLLIEDRPGMGKSTLAETLARGSSLAFKRVSFTSDLLPADLTGINVFDAGTAQFRFQAGPLFSQVLLADEISPDNCRLWDTQTNEKMDKDRFRRDLGGLLNAYQEIARRLCVAVPDLT